MTQTSETRDVTAAWQAPSLRGRIALLAATVVSLLTVTLCILIWALQSTQANIVGRSQKHLNAVAASMANAYIARADRSFSLSLAPSSSMENRRPAALPVEPPRPPIPDGAVGRPVPPKLPAPPELDPRSAGERGLAAISARILQDETGVEGGFYRPADGRLIAYAFPTHEGPGDPTALPARETPALVELAAAAVAQNRVQQDQFFGPHDVVLFLASPVCETKACAGGPVGAVWLMQRLPEAETDRKRTLLWSALGFGIVACVTVVLAFLALRQVGRGTQAVLDRLTDMESNLSHQPHPSSVGLAEFHRVLDGLDRFSDTLRDQIERERELQLRLRQNERLAAIGQLAAGVAHELRNPLATIRLRTQMAQRKTLEDTTTQAAAVILAEVDRLDAIIERLLDFSRPIRLSSSSVNVSALVESAVQRWSARSASITIRYTGDTETCAVADPVRLEQVLDNLLENAVNQLEEAATAQPKIDVHCELHNATVRLTIQDNGGGFTSDALRNATEPFFTTRAKGTGLGLAITQEIVHALGGTLTLSNDAAGAVIYIQIPQSESC